MVIVSFEKILKPTNQSLTCSAAAPATCELSNDDKEIRCPNTSPFVDPADLGIRQILKVSQDKEAHALMERKLTST